MLKCMIWIGVLIFSQFAYAMEPIQIINRIDQNEVYGSPVLKGDEYKAVWEGISQRVFKFAKGTE